MNNLGVIEYEARSTGNSETIRKAISYGRTRHRLQQPGRSLFRKKAFEKASEAYAKTLQLDSKSWNALLITAYQHLPSPGSGTLTTLIAKLCAGHGDRDDRALLRRALEDGYKAIGDVCKDQVRGRTQRRRFTPDGGASAGDTELSYVIT